jgi:hypothetical protein
MVIMKRSPRLYFCSPKLLQEKNIHGNYLQIPSSVDTVVDGLFYFLSLALAQHHWEVGWCSGGGWEFADKYLGYFSSGAV